MQKHFRILGCLVTAAVLSPAVTVTAIDSGWHSNGGQHMASNTNIYVGSFASNQYRNFFVFDLTSVSGTVSAVSLNIEQPSNGFTSATTEVYQLFNISSAISALVTSAPFGSPLTIYNDLGDGVSYGQVTLSSASNGTTVSIVFNAAGIAAVNAALGGQFAVGGILQDLTGPVPQASFDTSTGLRQLDITLTSGGNTGGGNTGGGGAVPEPGTVAMLGGALVAMGLARTKR